MEIQCNRWYEAITKRRSRRRYEPRPMEAGIVQTLENACIQFRPFEDSRAVLVSQPADKVFKGLIGNYGKIKGAQLFVAFVGNTSIWGSYNSSFNMMDASASLSS